MKFDVYLSNGNFYDFTENQIDFFKKLGMPHNETRFLNSEWDNLPFAMEFNGLEDFINFIARLGYNVSICNTKITIITNLNH